MKLRLFFIIAVLLRILSVRCQHAAICFAQLAKSFEIVDPISYSESDTLRLGINGSMQTPVPIRCACPKSPDTDDLLEILPVESTIADPKICQNPVRAVIQYAIESPNQVRTYYIGFDVFEKAVEKIYFVPVLEITFHSTLQTPVYAKYRYRSPNLNHMVFWSTLNYEPDHDYQSSDQFGEQDFDKLYSMDNQREIFRSFLNDPYYKRIFQSEKPILVKQQLAQRLDFLLDTWKEVTYFNVNTAPMFLAVQNTWKKIEVFVVKVAKALHRNLYITTGVSMVKKLINSKLESIPIYLNTKTTSPTKPVPHIFWKILQYTSVRDDEANKYGLLVIMHNDPLYRRQEAICTSILTVVEWEETMKDENEDDQSSYRNIAYICELNAENLRKLQLPVSLPVVENFLNVEQLKERFGIDSPNHAPVYRFV